MTGFVKHLELLTSPTGENAANEKHTVDEWARSVQIHRLESILTISLEGIEGIRKVIRDPMISVITILTVRL